MVDPEVIAERLKLLVGYIADLEDEQGTDWERFVGDKKLRRYVERTLQLAIECCLDIGNHIISAKGLREPQDNRDVFRVLAEAGYLPGDLLPACERMAGFRNVLVHEYARIDPAIVFAALKRRVPDLRRFASAIAPLAGAHEPPGSTPPETPNG